MEPYVQQFIDNLFSTTWIEWTGVLSGLLYVIFIANKRQIAWLFAIIGSFIYIYLCYISQYYLETFLQFFYLIMGVWGWVTWNRTKSENNFLSRWKLSNHLLNIGISALVTLILGYYFETYTNQSRPYLDAFTTVFSLAATFMVTQKVLENWLYWIVIDLVSIQLYLYKGYALTAVLMLVYTILAIYGYLQWRKAFKLQIA